MAYLTAHRALDMSIARSLRVREGALIEEHYTYHTEYRPAYQVLVGWQLLFTDPYTPLPVDVADGIWRLDYQAGDSVVAVTPAHTLSLEGSRDPRGLVTFSVEGVVYDFTGGISRIDSWPDTLEVFSRRQLSGGDWISGSDRADVLLGYAGTDWIAGNGGRDVLRGGGGSDTLDGGWNRDLLIGGRGNDLYYDCGPGDRVKEARDGGIDRVQLEGDFNGATFRADYVENVSYNGIGRIAIIAGAGSDAPGGGFLFWGGDTMIGGAGDDTLRGGSVMQGGAGNDAYYPTFADDTVIENPGEGTDTIFTYFDYSLAGTQVENITLTPGGSSGLRAAGNEFDNVLTSGGVGSATLEGGGGDDTLVGYDFDRFDGGSGVDRLKLADGDLDFARLPYGSIAEVEIIDMTAGGSVTLTLSVADVLAISSSTDTLTVLGNAGDTLHFGAGWSGGTLVGDFRTYTQGTATLIVGADVASVI